MMNLNTRINWAIGLLVKINAVTGWVNPDGLLMDVLVDQFEKKLNESYPTINPDEVEYAFRSYGTVIKDWGKQMNLSLIDEVMIPYVEKRFEISRKEEQQKTKTMKAEIGNEISDFELWEQTCELVNKRNYSAIFIPSSLYEWAVREGRIDLTGAQKMEYKTRAELVRHQNVVKDYEDNPHSNETKNILIHYNEMRNTQMYSKEENDKIIDIAKRLIIFSVMKKNPENE